jgi:hypothetical protein
MRGVGERLIPLIGAGLCARTLHNPNSANFAFWAFSEVRLYGHTSLTNGVLPARKGCGNYVVEREVSKGSVFRRLNASDHKDLPADSG